MNEPHRAKVSAEDGSSTEPRRRILFMNWRDTRNPEGGGSEVYVEKVAAALASQGHDVTVFCARHEEAPDEETRDGIHFVRAGTKLSVYLQGARLYREGRLGVPDVVIDVQNGIPFFTRLVRPKTPTVVLVHHVHREQWPLVYGPIRSRIGWSIESRLSPALYRGCTYVTVSHTTKQELVELGVNSDDIHVIHNGITPLDHPREAPLTSSNVVVLGRLVPHKRVELAIDAVVRLRQGAAPDTTLTVIGDGWWRDHLLAYAHDAGASEYVTFTGHVDDATKHSLLGDASVMLLPSVKEGWGLVVMEAALHGVPTIAFRSAKGVEESILDGVTGVLVDTPDEIGRALEELTVNNSLRRRLGDAARARTHDFSWEETAGQFGRVIASVLAGPSSA